MMKQETRNIIDKGAGMKCYGVIIIHDINGGDVEERKNGRPVTKACATHLALDAHIVNQLKRDPNIQGIPIHRYNFTSFVPPIPRRFSFNYTREIERKRERDSSRNEAAKILGNVCYIPSYSYTT